MTAERGIVQSLDRALSILDALAVAGDGLSLGDIASRTELAKSTAHRLLSTLEVRGFVSRDGPTGHYRLGLKNLPQLAPGPAIHEVLAGLAAASGETANLGALVGRDVMYMDRADSPHALRWQLGVGSRVPAYCSGLGKAILAHLPPDAIRRMLTGRLRAYTDRTITDPRAMRAELTLTRERGYAVDDEEFMEGVRCVAVPVRGVDGSVTASISLAGPAFRLTGETAQGQVPHLRAAAERISGLLAQRRGGLGASTGDGSKA